MVINTDELIVFLALEVSELQHQRIGQTRPPLPPRAPPAGGTGAGFGSMAHATPWRSHFQDLSPAVNETESESAERVKDWNGRWVPSYFPPDAEESVAASLAWSKAGSRVRVDGSTSTNSLPSAVVLRYQKRSPSNQVC